MLRPRFRHKLSKICRCCITHNVLVWTKDRGGLTKCETRDGDSKNDTISSFEFCDIDRER